MSSPISLTADGLADAVVSHSREVFVTFPAHLYARSTLRYRAQLIYIPSTTLSSLQFPLAWEKGIGTTVPDLPFTLRPFDAGDTSGNYGLNGANLAGSARMVPKESIPQILPGTHQGQVLPTVTVSGLAVTVTAGWYWVVFDCGAQPFVWSVLDGFSGTGCGPGDGTSFIVSKTTGSFNTSPTNAGTPGDAWNLSDAPQDIPMLVNGASTSDVRFSLDGSLWTAWEPFVSFAAGAWQSRFLKGMNLWDTTIGGGFQRSHRTVYTQLKRGVEVWADDGLGIDYVGETPVVRALHIFYKTSG